MNARVRPEVDSRSNPVYMVHNLQYITRDYYNTIRVMHMCSIYNVTEECKIPLLRAGRFAGAAECQSRFNSSQNRFHSLSGERLVKTRNNR